MEMQSALGRLISIHVLRKEDDCQKLQSEMQKDNFYPRPPQGGRPRQ